MKQNLKNTQPAEISITGYVDDENNSATYDQQQINERIEKQDDETDLVELIGQSCVLGGIQTAVVGFQLFPVPVALGICALNAVFAAPNLRIDLKNWDCQILDKKKLKFAIARQIITTTLASKTEIERTQTSQEANQSFEVYQRQQEAYTKSSHAPDYFFFGSVILLFCLMGFFFTRGRNK